MSRWGPEARPSTAEQKHSFLSACGFFSWLSLWGYGSELSKCLEREGLFLSMLAKSTSSPEGLANLA